MTQFPHNNDLQFSRRQICQVKVVSSPQIPQYFLQQQQITCHYKKIKTLAINQQILPQMKITPKGTIRKHKPKRFTNSCQWP